MRTENSTEQKIRARIERSNILNRLLILGSEQSSDIQGEYVDSLINLAKSLREVFKRAKIIKGIDYNPREFWPAQKNDRYCFIDGGVANIDLPSVAPLGIRVGSYIVRLGDETEERERFAIELDLVDELFSTDSFTYDDDFSDDTSKLQDAARMTMEVAAALKVVRSVRDISAVFLQGPLVNPVSPYGLATFPAFRKTAVKEFTGESFEDSSNRRDLHFVNIYLYLLEKLNKSNVPIFGSVERSVGRYPIVTELILIELKEKGELSKKDIGTIWDDIVTFKFNDQTIFNAVLEQGEYCSPVIVNRQGGENKWPDHWKPWIRKYPKPLTTYIKLSENSEPLRVETFESTLKLEHWYSILYYTSRLLPSYGFPVGLDIVDKYAKIPSWMSRSVKGQYATILLRQALDSGDPAAISFAKRILVAKGRDWLFRPSS